MQEKSFQIGVVGLGIIGSAISKHLLSSNHQIIGFDIDQNKLIENNEQRLTISMSLEELLRNSDVIITCLPNEQSLNDTVNQLVSLKDAAVKTIIEMSTLGIVCKSENKKKLIPKNIHLLDCPISGTGEQASRGDIVIYASGDEQSYKEIESIFNSFSKDCFYVGDFGNGSKIKLIANFLVSIHNVASAEAILLADQTGIDLEKIFEVISSGAGTSKIFELRAPMMMKREYKPATMKMNVWKKDMTLIREFIDLYGISTPLFAVTEELYESALEMGLEEEDTAAVYETLKKINKEGADQNEQ